MRRGEIQPTSNDNYLLEVARLEFIENAVDVWSGHIEKFEREYGKYIELPAVHVPQPTAVGEEPKARPGWLIRNLYSDLKVAQLTSTANLQPRTEDAALNSFDVFGLRTYAEMLLERALRVRSERNEIASRAAVLAVEMIEFLRKDFLFRKRVANGGLSFPYIEAVRIYESEKSLGKSNRTTYTSNQEELDSLYSEDAKALVSSEAQRAAFMSAKTAYSNDGRSEQSYGWPQLAAPNGTVFDHLRAAAQHATERELAQGERRLEREKTDNLGAAEAYDHRNVASREKAEFLLQSAKIDLQQHTDAVQITKAKLDAACTKGASLNYAGQETVLAEHLSAITRDILACVKALSRGLSVIYDHKAAIGPNARALFPQEDQIYFDGGGSDVGDGLIEVALWYQSVNHFLVARSHAERRTNKIISLRAAIGAADWRRFLEGGRQTFDADQALFPADGCPKLLGIGAVVIGGEAADIVELTFEIPREGLFWAPSGQQRRFDQGGGRSMLLSRLPRQGETAVPVSFKSDGVLGKSPLGSWMFQVSGVSDVEAIEDIHVIFAVVLS